MEFTGKQLGPLASGGKQTLDIALVRPGAFELRVRFDEAPFNGTQLNVEINGIKLLPYFAFGGDTRYDNVRGKPGLRPPLATMEGRWIIPSRLLGVGVNRLTVWTTGVQNSATLSRQGPAPAIRIGALYFGRADGGALPEFANSIYYDFNVWAQGYDYAAGDDNRYRKDLALLGVINGSGMPAVIPPLGGDEASLWAVKRQAESNALDWGMRHQEFYTIWEFAGKPGIWAKYVDVDRNPETQTKFHSQTLEPTVVANDPAAKGADVVLFDTEKYVKALEPAVRALAPYTDYYNFKCEQRSPKSEGFGFKGDAWEKFGMTGDAWARNSYEANKAARDLVQKYDAADGRVQEMNFWTPPLRHFMYDGALKRGQPMGGTIDIMMSHFGFMGLYERTAEGKLDPDHFNPELQYPGGTFDRSKLVYQAFWSALRDWRAVHDTAFPETAIDFNRYRLGRTEKDMKLADPKTHRWANGQPFDFRAGLRGDELMFNSENGVWRGYGAATPYQFLQGVFSYSLLPTGASEPRDLKMTTRQAIDKTTDIPVNLYGEWIDGIAGTKRLRTVDPLYGDLFGWTGNEHCNMGDYIDMVGIKDHHHRLPGNDAFGLVRRMCYAFVTTGPVVPSYQGAKHSEQLMVKTMAQVIDGKHYIGLYAANFNNKPQQLDVVLPIPLPQGAQALVFDDRAWDWKSAKPLNIRPGGGLNYRQMVPGLGSWLVLIPMPEGGLAAALGLPAAPKPATPVADGIVTEARPVLTWQAAPEDSNLRYLVEVAREALFRPIDRVELSPYLETNSYTMKAPPQEAWRYFWRVCSVKPYGKHGQWSQPVSFVYRWPEYSKRYPPSIGDPGAAPATAQAMPEWRKLADDNKMEAATNLAWQAEIFGTGGYMNAASRASDGDAATWWNNGGDDENSKFTRPAEWCAIWNTPVNIGSVKVLWRETLLPKEFAIQVSDDAKTWTDLLKQSNVKETATLLKLERPIAAKYLRVLITATHSEKGEVGVREVVVE